MQLALKFLVARSVQYATDIILSANELALVKLALKQFALFELKRATVYCCRVTTAQKLFGG